MTGPVSVEVAEVDMTGPCVCVCVCLCVCVWCVEVCARVRGRGKCEQKKKEGEVSFFVRRLGCFGQHTHTECISFYTCARAGRPARTHHQVRVGGRREGLSATQNHLSSNLPTRQHSTARVAQPSCPPHWGGRPGAPVAPRAFNAHANTQSLSFILASHTGGIVIKVSGRGTKGGNSESRGEKEGGQVQFFRPCCAPPAAS